VLYRVLAWQNKEVLALTADQTETNSAVRLFFRPGMVVQEIGYGDDVDEELRQAIDETTGKELVGEDFDGVADAVLLWFRDDDGDLTDALFDAIAHTKESGVILLLTPKVGRDGYIEPSDIGGASTTAGLSQSESIKVGGWTGSRLIVPQSAAKRR
jgi:hypothetical protein